MSKYGIPFTKVVTDGSGSDPLPVQLRGRMLPLMSFNGVSVADIRAAAEKLRPGDGASLLQEDFGTVFHVAGVQIDKEYATMEVLTRRGPAETKVRCPLAVIQNRETKEAMIKQAFVSLIALGKVELGLSNAVLNKAYEAAMTQVHDDQDPADAFERQGGGGRGGGGGPQCQQQ